MVMRRYQRQKVQRRKRVHEAIQVLLARAEAAAAEGVHEVEEACLKAIHAYRKKYHILLTPRDKIRYCPACYRIYPPSASRRISHSLKGLTLRITCPYCGHHRMVLLEKHAAQDNSERTK